MNPNPQSQKLWKKIRNENCKMCSLHEDAQSVCLLGDGPIKLGTPIVIGEAPGYREDELAIPFMGESGQFLRSMLREVGIDPSDLYITNTVACRPPAIRTPTRKEAKTCSSTYLVPQVESIKPRAILLLGNTAISFVTGRKATVTKMEGSTIDYKGITCVPCRHPSSIIRLRGMPREYNFSVKKFKENLSIFKRVLNPQRDTFKYTQDPPVLKYYCLDCKTYQSDEDRNLDKDCRCGGTTVPAPVYVDIESNGLNPFLPTSKIHSISIYQRGQKLPHAMPVTRENRKYTIDMLKRHPIMAHRITHEGMYFREHFGVSIRVHFDTKIGAFVRDENESSGLKYVAVRDLKVEPWGAEQDDWEDPDMEKLLPYNAKDSLYGDGLYEKIDRPYLRTHLKVAKLLKYILMPAQEVFIDVICNGFHIDIEEAKKRLQKCKEEKEVLNAQIDKVAEKKVNPASPKQMNWLFYEKLKLTCPVQSKSGNDSTAEASLVRLRGQHLIVELLEKWRDWNKKDNTYLTPWIERGPVLHANHGFTDVDTGRLNSTMVKNKRHEKKAGATLHQCPRDKFIRTLITPRGYSPWVNTSRCLRLRTAEETVKVSQISSSTKKDWCILAADLSQIELRLVAHEANEPTMIFIFNSGGDIHLDTARDVICGGDTSIEIDEETRKKAKAVNFGFVYGMWAKKFVAYALEKFNVKLSLRQGEQFREGYFSKYSKLLPWHLRVEKQVTLTGLATSIFGRIRHLPNAKNDELDEWIRRQAIRQAINSPIQSAGSDLLQLIMALMLSRSLDWGFKVDLTKAFAVGSAHDSMIYECRKDYAKELRDGIQYTVGQLPRLIKKWFDVEMRVPILMDVDVYESQWKGEKLKV